MTEPEFVIPMHRLPPGFAERVEHPPAVAAEPKAAATVVLVRDTGSAPELLLLERHRAAGFVPGAWVFPGGRVDDADGDPALVELVGPLPRGPAAEYWLAAIREVFEETGVLLARPDHDAVDEAGEGSALASWRMALMDESASLLEVLRAERLRPDIDRIVYCSRWITPVAEPRRYDTRFFLAGVPEGCSVEIDEREMSNAVWVTAHEALHRFSEGTLPMVFPTVKTIQLLEPYGTVDEMLDAFRESDVPPVLPRLVRTDDGIGIIMPDEVDT